MIVQNLKVSQVYANPKQPRKTFKASGIDELAKSIKVNGLIQPITVVKEDNPFAGAPDKFMIVAGERRFRAIQTLGLKEVKAIVIEATAAKVQELVLIENIQREDMNSVEIALAYQALIKSGLSIEEISTITGKNTQSIANLHTRAKKLPNRAKCSRCYKAIQI